MGFLIAAYLLAGFMLTMWIVRREARIVRRMGGADDIEALFLAGCTALLAIPLWPLLLAAVGLGRVVMLALAWVGWR